MSKGMKLVHNTYGKCAVRLLKVFRDGETHTVREIHVSVLLEGDFDENYTSADNRSCVPTDTVKNNVFAIAREQFTDTLEGFAIALADNYLERYAHVSLVRVEIEERPWSRIASQAHAFEGGAGGTPFTELVAPRDGGRTHLSGVKGLAVLKSTGSGFEGFHECDRTTLPPTGDRIFATSIDAAWTWNRAPQGEASANASIVTQMLQVFAEVYSPSVQRSLYLMAEAALNEVPTIESIHLVMPNSHYLLADLGKFGQENANEVFYPAPEPYGLIEATVRR